MFRYLPFEGDQAFDLLRNIVNAPIPFNSDFTPECLSLVSGLLEREPSKRLGVRGRGVLEIKRHEFFRGLNWEALELKRIKSPFSNISLTLSKLPFHECQTIDRAEDGDMPL